VIAVSESVRDDLVRRFELPGEMVTVIASGVETASVPDSRSRWNPDGSP